MVARPRPTRRTHARQTSRATHTSLRSLSLPYWMPVLLHVATPFSRRTPAHGAHGENTFFCLLGCHVQLNRDRLQHLAEPLVGMFIIVRVVHPTVGIHNREALPREYIDGFAGLLVHDVCIRLRTQEVEQLGVVGGAYRWQRASRAGAARIRRWAGEPGAGDGTRTRKAMSLLVETANLEWVLWAESDEKAISLSVRTPPSPSVY